MKVYALVFKIGISSGYEELIGMFDSTEKAEESKSCAVPNGIRK